MSVMLGEGGLGVAIRHRQSCSPCPVKASANSSWLSTGSSRCDCGQAGECRGEAIDDILAPLDLVAFAEPRGCFVSDPDRARGVLPHQHFQWQVDRSGLLTLHETTAHLRVAEDEHRRWTQLHGNATGVRGMIDPGKDLQVALHDRRVECSHRLVEVARAAYAYHAIVLRRGKER